MYDKRLASEYDMHRIYYSLRGTHKIIHLQYCLLIIIAESVLSVASICFLKIYFFPPYYLVFVNTAVNYIQSRTRDLEYIFIYCQKFLKRNFQLCYAFFN